MTKAAQHFVPEGLDGHFRTVFHAPLGIFWILWPEGAHVSRSFSEVILTLWVQKVDDGLRVTALVLGDRDPDGLVLALPAGLGEDLMWRLLKEYRSISADRHRLARFHDRLLGQPFCMTSFCAQEPQTAWQYPPVHAYGFSGTVVRSMGMSTRPWMETGYSSGRVMEIEYGSSPKTGTGSCYTGRKSTVT